MYSYKMNLHFCIHISLLFGLFDTLKIYIYVRRNAIKGNEIGSHRGGPLWFPEVKDNLSHIVFLIKFSV